jgi:hypothetical protein
VRLLLDEHIDPRVAAALRRRGYAVRAVAEDPKLRGLTDPELLDHAFAHGEAVVTYNARDFGPLVEERLAAGLAVAGVVFVSTHTYPPSGRGRLIAALAALLSGDEAIAVGDVRWLA